MKFLIAAAMLLLIVAMPVLGSDKVTICHAAGRAGTSKFVTITVSPQALAGHFDNNGTPMAGHEEDYFGPCTTNTQSTPSPEQSAVSSMTVMPSAPPTTQVSQKPMLTLIPNTSVSNNE